MNFPKLKSAVKHLQKNCPCMKCNTSYRQKDINVIAATKTEGLFELHCSKCKSSAIVTATLENPSNFFENDFPINKIKGVSENDVLDIKNFLTNFDGNFKKIFDLQDNF